MFHCSLCKRGLASPLNLIQLVSGLSFLPGETGDWGGASLAHHPQINSRTTVVLYCISANYLNKLCQQIISTNYLNKLSQQIISTNYLNKLSQQIISCQRECISIHVGQAGCQIGNACWELYCLEHGIYHLFFNLSLFLHLYLCLCQPMLVGSSTASSMVSIK